MDPLSSSTMTPSLIHLLHYARANASSLAIGEELTPQVVEMDVVDEKDKWKKRKSIVGIGLWICFTTNMWTCIENMNYMSVTAHFIDSSWKSHKKVLSFRKTMDHKGVTIGKELEDCMYE